MKSIKNLFVIFLFLIVNFHTSGQRETENWYFGNAASINFLNKNLTITNNSKMIAAKGCSSISDKNGNLIFYTDGINAYNSRHLKISGNRGMESDALTSQNVIIIPKPNSETMFYVFTIKSEEINDGGLGGLETNRTDKIKENFKPSLYYSVIDMSRNNDFGEFIESNVLVLENVSEKISAVHHQNGKDIWLVTHANDNGSPFFNDFHSILITENGVQNSIKSNMGDLFISDRKGHLKFSPNGEFLGMASNTSGGWIFKFDNSGGVINQPRRLGFSTSPGEIVNLYSVEFSIDSNKLYFEGQVGSNLTSNRLYQFDMSKVFAQNSSSNGIYSFLINRNKRVGALQLANNGKIYSAVNSGEDFINGEPYLSVINNPESDTNSGINLQENEINLQESKSRLGLPNFIQSYFRTRIITEKGCVDNDLLLEIDTYTTIQSASWNFGDGNNSNEIKPTHQYRNPGKYRVTARIFMNNFPIDLEKEIEIFPLPVVKTNEKIVQCNSGSGENKFNLTEIEEKIVNNTTNFLFSYFENDEDAIQGTNPIKDFDNYTSNDESKTMYVRAVNENGCFNVIPFTIELASVNLGSINEMFTCGIENPSINKTEGVFDLAQKRNEIKTSLGLDNSVTLSFYNNFNNAQTKRNELSDSFTSSTTKIWVRADTPLGCGGIESFDATVNNQPQITSINNNYVVCFDTSKHPAVIIQGDLSNDRFEWRNSDETIISRSDNFTLTTTGDYSLTVYKTENGIECSNRKDFSVNNPSSPIFEAVNVNTEDDTNNIVTVSVNGNSNYEFSLNNIDFFGGINSYTFSNVTSGLRTIYVRDINNCEQPIQTKVSVLGYLKFFTPNGDGNRDYWNINGLDKDLFKSLNINIFNRFGKVIGRINSFDNLGWDGTYNGKKLEANNYWFTAEIVDNDDNLIKKTGYFSLIRN